MTNELRVNFSSAANMGDQLNVDIIKKCFGYNVVRQGSLTAELSAIGSGLDGYKYGNSLSRNLVKLIHRSSMPTVYVWGTGFINYGKKREKFFTKDMVVTAVRGELTRKRLEKILKRNLDVPTGDPGILAPYLLESHPASEYEVGIIPHYKEQDETEFKYLSLKYDHSHIIDVKKSPLEVIVEIAECKVILSSSLHGLILADSLGIPNHHIVVTNNLMGDGFKFDDYYSSYGLNHEFTKVNNSTVIDLDQITKDYKITDEMVSEKQKDLIAAFPFPSLI